MICWLPVSHYGETAYTYCSIKCRLNRMVQFQRLWNRGLYFWGTSSIFFMFLGGRLRAWRVQLKGVQRGKTQMNKVQGRREGVVGGIQCKLEVGRATNKKSIFSLSYTLYLTIAHTISPARMNIWIYHLWKRNQQLHNYLFIYWCSAWSQQATCVALFLPLESSFFPPVAAWRPAYCAQDMTGPSWMFLFTCGSVCVCQPDVAA